ncbi:MAG TPA: hypothetical protein IAA62_05180 [Candidatus Caccopulliclostridium gallistercoris]|uniref:Uncharacterized protein n=1 Tax=Candidatus Caccopulliclostridium gallistercoris TaxID=2840719 RepID=A0A9D1NG96_9FIRM|nr:hypothetical protein [Candidatus Caccopulliclostridium gallistercoris]
MKFKNKKELKTEKEEYFIYSVLWEYTDDGSKMLPYIENKDKLINVITNEALDKKDFDNYNNLVGTKTLADIIAQRKYNISKYDTETILKSLYPFRFKNYISKKHILKLKNSFQKNLIKITKTENKIKLKEEKLEK